MRADKQQILADAPQVLNRDDLPWHVTVQGDSIVGAWKWMDARFFAPGSVSDEEREYVFTVTLQDNGKWKEVDSTTESTSSVRANGGKIGFGSSHSSFKGKTTQKSFSASFGRDKQTGETGMVSSKLDTTQLKDWIRGYLKQCGWKKAGLFG